MRETKAWRGRGEVGDQRGEGGDQRGDSEERER